MKNILIIPALLAVLGLAFAGAPVTAQTTASSAATPAAVQGDKVKGSITAIDTNANTVTIESNKKAGGATLVLSIVSTTKLTRDKQAATLADFKVGEKVKGTYVTGSSGTLLASTLKLSKDKGAKKDAVAPAPPTT